jgi:hypothetical protein
MTLPNTHILQSHVGRSDAEAVTASPEAVEQGDAELAAIGRSFPVSA